jgi:hypothetical protein
MGQVVEVAVQSPVLMSENGSVEVEEVEFGLGEEVKGNVPVAFACFTM